MSDMKNPTETITWAVNEAQRLYHEAGDTDWKILKEKNGLLKTVISGCQAIHSHTELLRMEQTYNATLSLRNEIKRMMHECDKRGIEVKVPKQLAGGV